MKKDKVAFIASGGGMSCAYSAGVASAFEEKNITVNIFIGSSGSAGTISYYASGQAKRAEKLWIEEVTNPRLIQSGPLKLDVDMIIDSMRDLFSLDEIKLRRDEVTLYLATTDNETLKPRFFCNHEKLDWYEVMRASMAIPFVYNKTIKIGNQTYFDGDVSTSLFDCVSLAKQAGATLIYVCDTRIFYPREIMRVLYNVKLRVLIKFIKGNIKKMFRLRRVQKNPQVVYLRPKHRLKTGILNNNKTAIEEAIEFGYSETMEFLSKK